MAQEPISDALLQQAIDAYAMHGSKLLAAQSLGLNPSTYNSRYRVGRDKGVKPTKQIIKQKSAAS